LRPSRFLDLARVDGRGAHRLAGGGDSDHY
jgi:hypothetical protein